MNVDQYDHPTKANVKNLLRQLKTNAGDPAQVVREVLSNSSDAKATYAALVPLPYPQNDAGFIIADDGEGMTRPVGYNKEGGHKVPFDVKNKYPQLCSFLDLANSLKKRGDGIGFLGLGSKLMWDSKRLAVVTKSKHETDDEKPFAVVDMLNPAENSNHRIARMTADEVLEFVLGSSSDDSAKSLLAYVQDESGEAERLEAFKDSVFKPWLENTAKKGGHGTLIFVQGVQEPSFGALMDNLDLAIGDEDEEAMLKCGFKRENTNKGKGDDLVELKTYMRFKTTAGSVLVKENLASAGFSEAQMELLVNEGRIKLEENVMAVKYLTLGNTHKTSEMPTIVPEDLRFCLKTLPKGYPFIPLTDEASGNVSDPKSRNPLRFDKNASFQDRHISSFMYQGKKYVVLVAVDGNYLRNKHWTMLDRSGTFGKRNPILSKYSSCTTKVNDQAGVLLCCEGVPMQNCTKILEHEAMGEYSKLAPGGKFNSHTHFTIIIDGPFDPTLDRTQVTKNALDGIYNDGFVKELKKVLDGLKAIPNPGNFGKLLQRATKENTEAKAQAVNQNWEAKTKAVLKQSRCKIECFDPSADTTSTLHFVLPTRGQEATVQHMYSVLSSMLDTKRHFDPQYGISDLASFWPELIHCNNAEGIDALGLPRRPLRQNCPPDFKRIPEGIATGELDNLEFKVDFNVPKEAKESFNHPLTLTDQIVCVNFRLGDNPVNVIPDPMPDNLKIVDEFGHSGMICVEYESGGEKISIPEILRGAAFFITDIRNNDNGNVGIQPAARTSRHGIIRVVNLMGLIKSTFNNINPVKERVRVFGTSLDDLEDDDDFKGASPCSGRGTPNGKRRGKVAATSRGGKAAASRSRGGGRSRGSGSRAVQDGDAGPSRKKSKR